MPSHPLDVQLHVLPGSLLVSVAGPIDHATAPAVEPVVDDALRRASAEGPPRVVVDLRGVSFMDSAGVHLLTGLAQRSGEGVRLELLAGTPVEHVLELVGCADVLPRADPADPVAAPA